MMSPIGPQGWALVSEVWPQDGCQALIDACQAKERITMPHRTIPAWKLALQGCAPLARRYLGPAISGIGSYYFSQSAGYATHLDNDYVQALPGCFLTVWLALADVGMDNGPLVIDGQAIPVPMGSALVLDGDLPHRSCAGRGPRPVAVLTYLKSGTAFRAGREERVEVSL